MKETIYTIPINDAFNTDCDCPLCVIENNIDKQYTEDSLGAGMMEPDLRIISNEKGYCKIHYKKMTDLQKALPLSLVLQSHSKYYNKKINALMKKADNKKSIFKKQNQARDFAKEITKQINEMSQKCVICEKCNETLNRYAKNIIYLWETDNTFKNKFENQNGFCLPHLSLLLQTADKELSDNDFCEFYNSIIENEKLSLNNIYNDISAFTTLFDYRSKKGPENKVKNAIKRTIQKYSGLL